MSRAGKFEEAKIETGPFFVPSNFPMNCNSSEETQQSSNKWLIEPTKRKSKVKPAKKYKTLMFNYIMCAKTFSGIIVTSE